MFEENLSNETQTEYWNLRYLVYYLGNPSFWELYLVVQELKKQLSNGTLTENWNLRYLMYILENPSFWELYLVVQVLKKSLLRVLKLKTKI